MTDPIAPSLQDLLAAKKSEILAIAQRHGAHNIRVFGSVARAEAAKNSDIDLVVDYGSTKRSPWFPISLIQELEALLQCKVDVATPAMLKLRIRDQVLEEATPL